MYLKFTWFLLLLRSALSDSQCTEKDSCDTMSESTEKKEESKGVPKIILGAMEFGRRADEDLSNKMMKEFQDKGRIEIDTAFM